MFYSTSKIEPDMEADLGRAIERAILSSCRHSSVGEFTIGRGFERLTAQHIQRLPFWMQKRTSKRPPRSIFVNLGK